MVMPRSYCDSLGDMEKDATTSVLSYSSLEQTNTKKAKLNWTKTKKKKKLNIIDLF